MKRLSVVTGVAAILFLIGPSAEAAKKPGLGPVAGSYSGRAVSKSGTTTLSDNGSLTFTGKETGLSGTFLYEGILNQNGVPLHVSQTFNLASSGAITGRVNVGDRSGSGSGKINLVKKVLFFSMVYRLGGEGTPTIQLVGKVLLAPKRANLTATVSSPDGSFNGKLTMNGRR